MLVAVTENGRFVQANELTVQAKTKLYHCPACKGAVRLKMGEVNLPYFAHVNLIECDSFAEGESAGHLTGKLAIRDYFHAQGAVVTLEQYFSEVQQRADVLVELNGGRFVIEYQCAPISVQKVIHRTAGYRRLGLRVIWVLGDTYQARQLSRATWAKFSQILHGELQLCVWRMQPGCFEWLSWMEQDFTHRQKQHVVKTKLAEIQLLKLQQQITRKDPYLQHIVLELYRLQRRLVGMPWMVHNIIGLPGGVKGEAWPVKLMLYLAIESGPKTQTQLLKQLANCEWQKFGVASVRQVQALWLNRMLTQWFEAGEIVVNDGQISLTTAPNWYADYQEKLAGLNIAPENNEKTSKK